MSLSEQDERALDMAMLETSISRLPCSKLYAMVLAGRERNAKMTDQHRMIIEEYSRRQKKGVSLTDDWRWVDGVRPWNDEEVRATAVRLKLLPDN